jgi:phosphoribosylaminoimidazolecarboxamide formyltransferase/IMP cyclohydrolase
MDVTIKRALLSVSDKTRPWWNWVRRWRSAVSNWSRPAARPRRCAMRAWKCGRFRPDRLSRDDGRPRQDAAPEVHGGLLAVRDNPSMSPPWRSMGLVRSTLWWSISIPLPRPSPRAHRPRRDYREYRHWRALHGALAAKNHRYVAIVTDPADYAALIAELESQGGATSLAFRKEMPPRPIAATAAYDA